MATKLGFQLESSLASKHLTDAQYIKGGYITVKSLTERNQLPIYVEDVSGSIIQDGVITEGSLVYVCDENKSFRYVNGTWTEDLTPDTVEQVVNKVSLSPTNTITQYPNAKSTYDTIKAEETRAMAAEAALNNKVENKTTAYITWTLRSDFPQFESYQYYKKEDGTPFQSESEINAYISGKTFGNSDLAEMADTVYFFGDKYFIMPSSAFAIPSPASLTIVKNASFFRPGDDIYTVGDAPDWWVGYTFEDTNEFCVYPYNAKADLTTKVDKLTDAGQYLYSHNGDTQGQIAVSDFATNVHAHGNITNAGAIGSTSGNAVFTTTNGVLIADSLATSSPSTDGNATAFIDTVSQDSKGKISATKKSIPNATTTAAGLMTAADKKKLDDIKTYSAGTGLSLNDTTFNHSNSVTAKTTAEFNKHSYDAQGHITGSTAVTKADITNLGIPGTDTNTTYTFAEGTTNGKFTVTPSGGSAQSVAIHGLGSAAYTNSTSYDAYGAAESAELNAKNYADNVVLDYQKILDTSLQTEYKSVVGAINEVNTKAIQAQTDVNTETSRATAAEQALNNKIEAKTTAYTSTTVNFPPWGIYQYYYREDGTPFNSSEEITTYLDGRTVCLNNTEFNKTDATLSIDTSNAYMLVHKLGSGHSVSSSAFTIVKNFDTFFKIGDDIYLIESSVPDRWFGGYTDNSPFPGVTVDFYAYDAKADLSTKVDKITTPSAYPFSQVYVTKNDGTQGAVGYTDSMIPSTLVQRDGNGFIHAGATPTANDHVASKEYVDNATCVSLISQSDFESMFN